MGALNDFIGIIQDELQPFLFRMSATPSGIFVSNLRATIVRDPAQAAEPELIPREKFLVEVHSHLIEIDAALTALRSIELYVRRFPYRKTSITESAYLRYHIENYLNEVYLLKERTLVLVRRLARRYRSDPILQVLHQQSEILVKAIEEILAPIVRPRGDHVHQRRYDDAALAQLSLVEYAARRDPELAPAYQLMYRQIRKEKRLWIAANNHEIEAAIDDVFAILMSCLTASGALIYPPGLR